MSRSAGTGQPIAFVCPVARRNREGMWGHGNVPSYPRGHKRIVRTGRSKPYHPGIGGARVLFERHEYECECGHIGWTRLADILRYPLKV